MIRIEAQMNVLNFKKLLDIIPVNITVLSFKTDYASADMIILIKKKDSYASIEGTTDSLGYFTINVSALPLNFFSVDMGLYYFKFFVNTAPITISGFEGIALFFRDVIGLDTQYIVNVSTGVIVLPIYTPPIGPGSWVSNASGIIQMQPGIGYSYEGTANIQYDLPLISNKSDGMWLVNDGTGHVVLTQSAGQSVRFGDTKTTVGVSGMVVSFSQGDSMQLKCTVANLEWMIITAVGTLTLY